MRRPAFDGAGYAGAHKKETFSSLGLWCANQYCRERDELGARRPAIPVSNIRGDHRATRHEA